MKAYNEQGIYNREVVWQVERWFKRGLLTREQMTTVVRDYPVPFRQTNGILEIGLFLFTTIAVIGTFLLLITVVSGSLDERTSFGVFSIVFGVGAGIVGGQLVRRKQLYRNGVDNAFAVLTTGFLTLGLLLFMPESLTIATYCLLALPFLGLALWYYGDTILAFVTLATFYTFVFDEMIQFGGGITALPFVLMIVSAVLYVVVTSFNRRSTELKQIIRLIYYADPLKLVESLSLVMLVASSNYFVVREVNALLLKTGHTVSPELALSWLFWLLTFIIPGAFLTRGFLRKDRLLINIGGLGLIAAVATLHYYTALVPLNVALTLGGLLLAGLAVAGIRYLQAGRSRHGFTDAPDDDVKDGLGINAELLTTIQATAGAQQNPKEGVRFGGGDFGGAGSEGRY